ncbi:endonuclease/exonuclease/phosphatase family protein [Pyxidicoccus sp. 3LG]
MELTLVSYNIHSGIGTDGRFDLSRVGEVLREVGADIVALQEVGDFRAKTPREDQPEHLADMLGLHMAFGPNVVRNGRRYGNAILSRLPIVKSKNYDLSVGRREPRGALRCDLDLGGGSQLHVFSLHLGLRMGERRRQEALLLSADILREAARKDPLVVCGDFNYLGNGPVPSLVRQAIHDAALELRAPARTYPTADAHACGWTGIYVDAGCGPASAYPPAYYASAAVGYVTSFEGPLLHRLFASRMASVLWWCVTALAMFVLGVSFFGRVWDGVLLGLLAATQPMIGFMSAVVNNDAGLFACSAMVLAALCVASRSPDSRRRALAVVAVGSLVGVMSKATFIFCLPVFFVFCAVALGAGQRRSWGVAALTFAPAGLAAAAWMLLWPVSTGAVLNAPTMTLSVGEYLETYVFNLQRLEWLWVQMYWMVWGWVDTHVRVGYFRVLTYLLALGAVGLALGWRTASARERVTVLLGLGGTVALMVVFYALEFVVMRKTNAPFIQGRYLLPLFPLHAVTWVLGLRWLSRTLRSPLDAAWVLVPTLLLLDVSAVLRALARYYA